MDADATDHDGPERPSNTKEGASTHACPQAGAILRVWAYRGDEPGVRLVLDHLRRHGVPHTLMTIEGDAYRYSRLRSLIASEILRFPIIEQAGRIIRLEDLPTVRPRQPHA